MGSLYHATLLAATVYLPVSPLPKKKRAVLLPPPLHTPNIASSEFPRLFYCVRLQQQIPAPGFRPANVNSFLPTLWRNSHFPF